MSHYFRFILSWIGGNQQYASIIYVHCSPGSVDHDMVMVTHHDHTLIKEGAAHRLIYYYYDIFSKTVLWIGPAVTLCLSEITDNNCSILESFSIVLRNYVRCKVCEKDELFNNA